MTENTKLDFNEAFVQYRNIKIEASQYKTVDLEDVEKWDFHNYVPQLVCSCTRLMHAGVATCLSIHASFVSRKSVANCLSILARIAN